MKAPLKMAGCTLDRLVLRSSSEVSLNDRFSQTLRAPVLVKGEPPLEHLGCDLEVRTVQPRKSVQQRLTRAPPGAQLGGPRPRVLALGPGPPGGGDLSPAELEGRFLGARRCPCALWGMRLLSRRYGWAGRALRARPPGARPPGARPPGARPPGWGGFTPNRLGWRRRWPGGTGTTSTPDQTNTWTCTNPPPVRTNTWTRTNPPPVQTNTWQHAPKQGWRSQVQRSVPSKEELDRQLDDYMSTSRSRLDAQLDAYRALAGRPHADDDRKLYDSDDAE